MTLNKDRSKNIYALICFIAIIALAVFAGITYEVNDDLGIARCISQSVEGSTIFQHKWIIWILHGLYCAVEHINWWTIMSISAVAFGSASVVYVLTQDTKKYAGVVIAAIISLLSYICMIAQMNFTRTAAALIAGSMSLSTISNSVASKKVCIYLISALLLIWGCAIRQNVALMAMPFYCVFAFAVVLHNFKRNEKIHTKVMCKRLAWIPISFIIIGLTIVVNNCIMTEADKKYVEYNSARSSVQDYIGSLLPFDEYESEYAAIDVSETDLDTLKNWISEDTEFFTTEKLTEIGAKKIKKSVDDIVPAAISLIRRILSGDSPFIILIVIMVVSVLCIVLRRWKDLLVSIVTLIMTFVLMLYFEYCGRLPERVMFAFMWFCLVTILLSIQYGNQIIAIKKSKSINGEIEHRVLPFVIILTGCLVALCLIIKIYPNRITPFNDSDIKQTQEAQLYDFINEDRDRIYMAHPTGTSPEFTYICGTWGMADPDYCKNLVNLGGWGQRRDYNIQVLDSYGISNPVRALIERDDVVFLNDDLEVNNIILSFLREHYETNVNYSVPAKMGNNYVAKYQVLIPDEEIMAEEIRELVGIQTMNDEFGHALVYGVVEGDIDRLFCNVTCNGTRHTYFLGYGNEFTAQLHDFIVEEIDVAMPIFFTR